jgi:hypothetical protein
VARCRALLSGAPTLHPAGLHEVTGVLNRTLYESWLSAMYGLLGGEDAVDELVEDYDYETRRLFDRLGRSVADLPDGKKLSTYARAQRLQAVMVEQQIPNRTFPTDAYKTLYAGESYHSVHGVAPIDGYVISRNWGLEVVTKRQESDQQVRQRLALAIAIFVSAAQITRKRIGVPADELDELITRLLLAHGPAVEQPEAEARREPPNGPAPA